MNGEKFYHVYQPIVNVRMKSVIGYEAFLRSYDEPNPLTLFKQARENGELSQIDFMSIKQASHINIKDRFLFLNVFPSTILDYQSYTAITQLVCQFKYKNRIILELNEANEESMCWEELEFFNKIEHLRNSGILIAIDDVGKGQASLEKIIEFKPDYIKLDRYFSKGLHDNKCKQDVVSFFVEYCQKRSTLILEGIEDEKDMRTSVTLGVDCLQGYLFGKPLIKTRLNQTEKGILHFCDN